MLLNISLWLKRLIIVVPSMAVPLVPGDVVATYTPTWVEWAITAGSFAAFGLIFAVFSKLFPMVAIWEIREGAHATSAPQAAPGGTAPVRAGGKGGA